MTLQKHEIANIQKVDAEPNVSWIKTNSLVTINAHVQLARIAIPLAAPRTRDGKISDMISIGIGPQPREKPIIYKTRHTTGSFPQSVTPLFTL